MGTLDCGQLLWERNEAFVLDAIKIVPDGLPGQVHTVGLTDGVKLVFGDLYRVPVKYKQNISQYSALKPILKWFLSFLHGLIMMTEW